MDFINIVQDSSRKGVVQVRPSLHISNNKDMIVKGGRVHAFWNGNGWDSDVYSLISCVDTRVMDESQRLLAKYPDGGGPLIIPMKFCDSSNYTYSQFTKAVSLLPDSPVQLDSKIIFKSTPTRRDDFAIKRLSYDPGDPNDTPAFDEMMRVLYSDEELDKIMWSIGSVLTNHAKHHSKFLYLYGAKGTGKGTALKIMKMLFEDYQEPIDLNILTSNSQFATGQIRESLVMIDDDSDISKIANDTILLKLTSHEPIGINRKHQAVYDYIFDGMLITASNQPFKVRNIDSGITRRALVVRPSNRKLDRSTYDRLMRGVKKEIPNIAAKAMAIFEDMGLNHYEEYIDKAIIEETNTFHRFMLDTYYELGNEVTLNRAAGLYEEWLEDEGYSTAGYKKVAKAELMRYFTDYKERGKVYSGLKVELFTEEYEVQEKYTPEIPRVEFSECESFFDLLEADSFAQYAGPNGTPSQPWDKVTTKLKDLDTSMLHYVRIPENHIVIDFDLKGPNGEKALDLNVEASKSWPETYTEVSKSGEGLHLHYIYDGDPTKLDPVYDEDIEVKVYSGKSSLRRKLTVCNDKEIAHLPAGYLPYKKENTRMLKDIEKLIKDEQELRTMIDKNLRKEIHAQTKPSVDFIVSLIKEAEQAGVKYDIRDLRQHITVFAMGSTNQKAACMNALTGVNFNTMETEISHKHTQNHIVPNEQLWFFDIEVFPNVNMVGFKQYKQDNYRYLINPTPEEITDLLKKPLVGFNCRGYDNHILWAMKMGYSPFEIYNVSKAIIGNSPNARYMQAYGLSYTDIYCYSTKKQSLKKWQVELGLKHDELEFDWDAPLPEEHWERAAEYMGNDVYSTEDVFDATKADYTGRCIIAELTGLSPNTKTTNLAAGFIFGVGNKEPQKDFIYTDLSEMFPGYSYKYDHELKKCVSIYKGQITDEDESFGQHPESGINPSEGGYIYAEPGAYENVGLVDVESMHPNSLVNMNYFGPYTQRYADLLQTRIFIKHEDYHSARKMFGGQLVKYLEDPKMAKDLSFALKIIINIVYGMTSAKFDNPFKHPKNVDNIVAKRGALFMIDLQHAVQEQGYVVPHIKTDSIKIANVDEDIVNFCHKFAERYGYRFEWEATYDKFVLISKTDYVAYDKWGWHVTGATFQHPYVFKKCLSHEPIEPDDFSLVKTVKDAKIYIGEEHIGKVANVYASTAGEVMKRVTDDSESFISGTKDALWKLYSDFDASDVDMNFYENMAAKSFGKAELLIGDKTCSDGSPYLSFGNRTEPLLVK